MVFFEKKSTKAFAADGVTAIIQYTVTSMQH